MATSPRPSRAAVLIAGLAVLVLANLDLLTGGAPTTVIPLILTVPAVLLIGVALGKGRTSEQPTTKASAGAAPEPAPHLPNA